MISPGLKKEITKYGLLVKTKGLKLMEMVSWLRIEHQVAMAT